MSLPAEDDYIGLGTPAFTQSTPGDARRVSLATFAPACATAPAPSATPASTSPALSDPSSAMLPSVSPSIRSSIRPSSVRFSADCLAYELSNPSSAPPSVAPSPGVEYVSLPPHNDDEYTFYIQYMPAQPEFAVSQSYAEVFAGIKVEYAANGARHVPDGPKPDTGRPKKPYKPVARKVKPLQERMPEEYRIERHRLADCMDGLPTLPTRPPLWEPTTPHLTRERMAGFALDQGDFLWPEEVKLFQYLIEWHQEVFAWEERERRRFRDDYFPPIKFPVVPHEPWTDRNIPIPHAIRDRVIALLKDKIAAGVYEPSTSAYRSGWFCVVKKDGSSLRIVHDLQRLNSVTIRDAGTLPSPDEVSERCAGRVCIGALDQFSSYDLQLVHPDSRDLTTFQTLVGTLRLTCLPQGYSNAVAIQHGNLLFLLSPEMPENVEVFVDDVHPLGPRTYYRRDDGSYETIPDNDGIRRFIWEYALSLNRIIQRLRHAGASISGKKAQICVPQLVVVGYEVSFEGRRPLQDKVQRVIDWPRCRNPSDVRAFLGTVGLARLWIRNFALIARPLTNLVKKDIPFEFDDDCHEAMLRLKEAVARAPCIKPIDYRCDRDVILAVDSSIHGVGFILLQLGPAGERCPARFGSIAWNEVEARYSQPKIELYGLWRSLRNVRIYVFGLPVLLVEMDAKYIKGMLNHPDLQPNATINRWIAGVQLFNIKIVHVPAERHTAADGLSRRQPSPDDPEESDDAEEWLDHALGLWFAAHLSLPYHTLPMVSRVGKLIVDDRSSARERAYSKVPRGGLFAASSAHVMLSDAPERLTPSLPANVLEDGSIIVPPRSETLQRKDAQLGDFEDYLRTFKKPSTLAAKHVPWFTRQVLKFFISAQGRLMRRDEHGKHKIVIRQPDRRVAILESAHDDTGHKGAFPTEALIRERFWWPGLAEDVRWYCSTCDICQRRTTFKLKIPPSVAAIATLFQRIYIDTMHLPTSHGFKYLVQARCSLTSMPEARALRRETARSLADFFFEDILCRWGFCCEWITDNGKPFVAALDELERRYGIRHIRISGYNSQANGAVERKHYDVRESLVKLCDGDMSRWHDVYHLVLWAERVTVRRSTGMSPFYMAHGVEPIMPLDLAEATYLVQPPELPLSTTDLVVLRARQLQRREDDLNTVRERVLESRNKNMLDYMRRHGSSVKDWNFEPGTLVLVRNTRIEKDLGLKKTEDRYYGPMVVVRRRAGGAYTVAELDGSVSILRCARFRVIPYFPRYGMIYDVRDILEAAEAQLQLIQKLDDNAEEDGNQEDAADDDDALRL